MYQKERLENIVQIVKQHGYVTVKYLVSSLHYSNATINRDLNLLVAQKRIRRSYGGVEYIEKKGVALPFRSSYMRKEKLKIGKKATELIDDNDTVFIDASTTTERMVQFLAEKKGITVITNNMAVVMHLSEFGIKTVCLGGTVIEPPYMLGGEETVENALKYRVDKMFFSVGYVTENGFVSEASLLHRVMLKNAKKVYLLTNKSKLVDDLGTVFCDFNALTGVISDFDFSEETKKSFPNTKCICVTN